jgi:hypothetical protein
MKKDSININSVEGATEYLKKEGVNVDAYIEKGLTELNETCKFCQGLGYDPYLFQMEGINVLCPDCKGEKLNKTQ